MRATSLFLLCLLITGAVPVRAELHSAYRRYTAVSLTISEANAIGKVDGFADRSWAQQAGSSLPSPMLPADSVWQPSFGFSLGVGQMRTKNAFYGLRFDFTRMHTTDQVAATFTDPDRGSSTTVIDLDGMGLTADVYDVALAIDYMLLSPYSSRVSPFVGPFMQATAATVSGTGMDTRTGRTFQNANTFHFGAGLSFGVMVNMWATGEQENFISLASVNRVDLYHTGHLSKLLNFGLGIRYHFCL